MKKQLITFTILLVTIAVNASAIVPCIRVTSEHTADTTDLARFRNFHAWKDKEGNELALAVWRYLSDYETGLYHFNEIIENDDPFVEYATVRDPLKILNVYNMGYCGIFGPVLDGIYHGIGFEQGRSFGLVDWDHCATEVWCDGQWRYFDLDVRGVLLDKDGKAVSLNQAQKRRDLWIDPPVAIEPFFPNDPDKDRVFDIYNGSPVNYYYRWFEGGHTMDFYLRQGESFTRWWTPQGGRWNHRLRYNQTEWVRKLIETEPKGMKPNHRDFTPWNHGNGRFFYQPNLTNSSSDFTDGVLMADNLTPGEDGLQLEKTGEAYAVFDIFTPYIIVGKVNDLDDPADDSEASVVTLNAACPVTVSISKDHGLTWIAVTDVSSNKTIKLDLTRYVNQTYGYWLKLSMKGWKNTLAVRELAIDTWTQVAPISLPRLKQGLNHLRYDLGDRYGNMTIPVPIVPNAGDAGDLSKYLVAPIERYEPGTPTERIVGDAILRFAAPPGRRIAWLTLGGSFRTDQGEYAVNTDNRIAYAVDRPESFHEIYKADVPDWVNHWRYNWDGDVMLENPAETIYAKYSGKPAVNTFRACLHLVPKRPIKKAVRIVHGYKIDGALRQANVELDGPSDYTVACESEPENVFIRIEAPSDAISDPVQK